MFRRTLRNNVADTHGHGLLATSGLRCAGCAIKQMANLESIPHPKKV
jgi:hypothetical protein